MTITQQQLDNLRAYFEKWAERTFTVVEGKEADTAIVELKFDLVFREMGEGK